MIEKNFLQLDGIGMMIARERTDTYGSPFEMRTEFDVT